MTILKSEVVKAIVVVIEDMVQRKTLEEATNLKILKNQAPDFPAQRAKSLAIIATSAPI